MKGYEYLAKFMHDKYEEEAKRVGWNTQDKCKVEYENLPEKNKQVMDEIAKQIMESYFGDCKIILNCICEEIDNFKDDTPYIAKQYSDAIQRIKSLLKEKN